MKNPLAFATSCMNGNATQSHLQEGMTLLDYFAGQALTGLLIKSPNYIGNAERAYEVAIQMLEERKKYEKII